MASLLGGAPPATLRPTFVFKKLLGQKQAAFVCATSDLGKPIRHAKCRNKQNVTKKVRAFTVI